MQIAIVADEATRAGWLSTGTGEGVETIWLDSPACPENTDACIDLLFTGEPLRVQLWLDCSPPLVLVNDVLKEHVLPPCFVRLNGWPSFLQRPLAETAGPDALKDITTAVLAAYHRTAEWVPDIPGFLTARVVSMIINEAYFALEEGVSSKAETDTAMKLGTNYPMGPFEWAEKIGVQQVYALLEKLSRENPRYTPSALLKKEAMAV